MNWNLPLVASAMLTTLGLASCQGSRSSGATVHNPTVEEMSRLEAQWGTQPKTKPIQIGAPAQTPGVYVPDSSSPAPVLPPATASVPLESVQPATSVTPDLKKKLGP
jgi:hypothetical protein